MDTLKMRANIYSSLIILPIVAGLMSVRAICPTKLTEAVKHCLQGYDTYSITIGHPTNLMYGTDVEVIRLLCSHYKHSMLCVDFLKTDCSSDSAAIREIDRLTVNVLHLKDLCMKNDFYEKYAMNQHCFKSVHQQSSQCYRQFEKQTEQMLPEALVGIRPAVLSTCQFYDKLTECIKDVIDNSGCGVRATDLVDYLVTPAVRVGKTCNERTPVTTQSPVKPTRPSKHRGRRPYQSRKNDSYKFKMEPPESSSTSWGAETLLVSSIAATLTLLLAH